jgi:hypothetical protein
MLLVNVELVSSAIFQIRRICLTARFCVSHLSAFFLAPPTLLKNQAYTVLRLVAETPH